MKFFELKTFRSATSPVILIRCILGMGIFEYPIGRPRRVISFCWSSVWLILFLYFVTVPIRENLSIERHRAYTATSYVLFTVVATNCGTTMILFAQLKSKKLMNFHCELDKVNEMLKKFGITKEYGPAFRSHIISLIGTVVFMSTMILAFFYTSYTNNSGLLIGSTISRQYIVFVCFLETYTFSSYVRYIGNRFRHLNSYLVELSINDGISASFLGELQNHIPGPFPSTVENQANPQHVPIADQQSMMRILWNAKKIHQHLCNIAKNLNEEFAVQILSSMVLVTVALTGTLFNLYILFLKSLKATDDMTIQILLIWPWIGFFVMQILCVVFACSMASAEAQRTAEEIHKLVKPSTCVEVRDEIYVLSLRIMQDPLKFTIYGFFNLDMAMIRAVFGTITTYLVIIIQNSGTPARDNKTATTTTLSNV